MASKHGEQLSIPSVWQRTLSITQCLASLSRNPMERHNSLNSVYVSVDTRESPRQSVAEADDQLKLAGALV